MKEVTEPTAPQPPRRQVSLRGDRSSPKSSGRHSNSNSGSFSPTQPQHPRTQTPESYAHSHAYRHVSLATQAQTHTPPLQTINTNITRAERTPEVPVASSVRTPDKSLPVQELDDDHADSRLEGSPLPSSDLIPEYAYGGRSSSRSGHRRSLDNHPKALSKANRMPDEDEDETLFEKSDMDRQNDDQEGDDVYSFTPKSSQVGLPDTQPQRQQPNRPSNSPAAVATTSRERPRSSDQLPSQKPLSPSNLPRSSQGQLQPPLHIYPHFHPAFNNPGTPDNQSLYSGNGSFNSAEMMDHPTSAYMAYLRSSYPAYESFRTSSNHSRGSSLRPRDDRPDAPIPPTPHSQTNPPSPSPLLSGPYALDDMSSVSQVMDGIYLRGELEGFDGMGVESGREYLPPFSPIVPAGSPYPYPFSHVRRAKSYANHPNPLANSRTQSSSHNGGEAASAGAGNNANNARPQTTTNSNNSSAAAAAAANLTNIDIIHEQFARQWQIYAQNLQAQLDSENGYGDVTDSTFSPPSATASLLPPINRTGTGMGINGHVPFNPWAYWHTQRLLGRNNGGSGSLTARSSPSHEPVDLPPIPPSVGVRRKGRSMDLRGQTGVGRGMVPSPVGYPNVYMGSGNRSGRESVQGLGLSGFSNLGRPRSTKPPQPHPLRQGRKPPPRVQSTQPRDTSPELESSDSGEQTAGENHNHFAVEEEEDSWVNGGSPPVPIPSVGINGKGLSLSAPSTPINIVGPQPLPLPATVPIPIVDDSIGSGNETVAVMDSHSNDWVDDDEYSDEDDFLELEYHPSFVSNAEKRRRRWENKWEALNQAFNALDRQTDATMILLAAPSHSSKLHMVTSRSIRRHSDIPKSSSINTIRAGFKQIAVQRRRARTMKTSLAERFLSMSGHSHSSASGASGDGSDGSSDLSSTRKEEDLKRALDAALGSLGFLGNLYEEREARWMEEMRRVGEERERVALLLTQILGEKSRENESSPGAESTAESVTAQSVTSVGVDTSDTN
ncbi:hypothetical protein VKT23_019797 [Stygiomarasmius scandens]|uniref:BHLH domain-containing protein n=1 Tax=Marasmiellus scandens TaxID=2682957 RepID=A0ABR1INT4_9AGAR